jgi:RNA polymerase sigma-70 factor (ECF subfamily)
MTAGLRIVSATVRPDEHPNDGTRGTLGAVLYARKASGLAQEQEWVAIIRSIAAGDQAALHALYERTHGVVFTLIVRITHSRETAEELTLDVFHDVWRRAPRYDAADGSVVGWILNQARSRAIDRLRFEQRKKRVNPHADESPEPFSSDSSESLELREQARRLRDALSLLSPDERAVIETAFFSEFTYTEVAARLNQPIGTVKTRIRSALGKLRQALTPELRET